MRYKLILTQGQLIAVFLSEGCRHTVTVRQKISPNDLSFCNSGTYSDCDCIWGIRCLVIIFWDLRSSAISRSAEWQFRTDISGQPQGPVFKGQEVHSFPALRQILTTADLRLSRGGNICDTMGDKLWLFSQSGNTEYFRQSNCTVPY